MERGEFGPFPTPAEALVYEMTPAESERVSSRREYQILGIREPVRGQLDALAASGGAEELFVVSITHEFRQRVRCYELLMQTD